MQILHLGDLELTLPLAAAVGTWLLAARSWRAAAAWAVLYGGAVGLVGGSKIAYLAWGVDIPMLDFKAISGHATGVTAVYPLVGYLLCRHAGGRAGLAAMAAGLLLGAVVAVELVRQDEHSAAEAAAGWMLGAGVSVGTVYQTEPAGVSLNLASAASAALVFMVAASLMQSAHVGYWMIKVALALSGNARPYSWDSCG
ncbi:phosphoesterase [Massilia consociata]|uniref:Phosphoesterase n=1 Tax=Massilia consociata TaxID=760117 RepID=A0ABV6FGJ2_9BURK